MGTVAGTVRALCGHCAGTVYFPSAETPAGGSRTQHSAVVREHYVFLRFGTLRRVGGIEDRFSRGSLMVSAAGRGGSPVWYDTTHA